MFPTKLGTKSNNPHDNEGFRYGVIIVDLEIHKVQCS